VKAIRSADPSGEKAKKQGGDLSPITLHPAFMQAIQLELFDYQDSLEFKYEYQLTSGPLRIDLLIIKKPKQFPIDKNIARIFRTENILEYKSPEDYISIKDFLKVYAYANLYVAITPEVDLSDVTITFVESRYPRKLLEYLISTRHYKVTETCRGIYEVSGDYIPIQIIETKRLSENENLWLKLLTKDLEISSNNGMVNKIKKRMKEARFRAYFYTASRINPEIFLEVLKMGKKARRSFEEVFTEAGIIPEWIEQGREQGLEQGREQGIEQGIEQGKEQGKEEVARNLLAMNIPMEVIAQAANLPIERIRVLAAG